MFTGSKLKSLCMTFMATFLLICIAEAKPTPGNIAIGETVPSYLGIDRENNKINANDYLGKVLVVTFWASWCGPCIKEMQTLENLQNVAKKSVQVIAINIEDRDKFKSVARALNTLTLKLAHDYTKSVAEKFGVKGIPHMLIVGRDGKVINVHRGYGDGMIPPLAAEITASMAVKPVETGAALDVKSVKEATQ